MATVADAITSAKWHARQHVSEADAFTADQWAACMRRAWRRLWGRWPEAFFANGERVGDLPELPVESAAELPIDAQWIDVLGAAMASDALWSMVGDTPERIESTAAAAGRLDGVVARGMG